MTSIALLRVGLGGEPLAALVGGLWGTKRDWAGG